MKEIALKTTKNKILCLDYDNNRQQQADPSKYETWSIRPGW